MSRQSWNPLENKKLPVDLRKENILIDWDISSDDFRLIENKHENKPCNYNFEKLLIPCHKEDIEKIPVILSILNSQKL